MVAEIKMKFGDSEVVYSVRNQTWTVEGISEATMLKVAPEKTAAINVALAKEVAEYQERVAKEEKEEAEKEIARIAKRQTEITAFRTTVEPLLWTGFSATFSEAGDRYSRATQEVSIQKDAVSADVLFAEKVYSGSYLRTTDRPWRVSFDFKNTRHATLEKAIASACKKIDEKLAENARLKVVKEAKQLATQNTAGYLAGLGIQMTAETAYYEGARGRRNGSSYEVKKAKIVVSDSAPDDKYSKKVVVSSNLLQEKDDSYKVAHITISGHFTLEQFKKLAEAVKEINPEPASNY